MNLNLELREETRGGTSGRRANLVRRALATAQVAHRARAARRRGTAARELPRRHAPRLGFDPANVVTANVSLPARPTRTAPALVAFEQRALDGAARDSRRRGRRRDVARALQRQQQQQRDHGRGLRHEAGRVAARADAGHGVARLLRGDAASGSCEGRTFDARDTTDAPRTVIVDERLATQVLARPGRRSAGGCIMPSDPKDIHEDHPQNAVLSPSSASSRKCR